jgi:hypothetical protein
MHRQRQLLLVYDKTAAMTITVVPSDMSVSKPNRRELLEAFSRFAIDFLDMWERSQSAMMMMMIAMIIILIAMMFAM